MYICANLNVLREIHQRQGHYLAQSLLLVHIFVNAAKSMQP